MWFHKLRGYCCPADLYGGEGYYFTDIEVY